MNGNFHLVDSGWKSLFNKAAKQSKQARLRIICPFIKKRVIESLVQKGKPSDIQIITRFNLCDFYNGVSDISALQFLLKRGAQIRGIRNLHAKLYLFGESRAIITSANLTDAALSRNHEFGFFADDEQILSHCQNYFDELWNKAGSNLSLVQTEEWDKKVTEQLAKGAKPSSLADLGDEGVETGKTIPAIELPPWVADANQAFVKFFGVSNDRADHSLPVLEEVKRAGCHWACTYPKNKRPRQVENGDLMFMGRLVKDPHDIIIFGRAVAMAHDPQRDDATAAEIELRPFKEKWPHYIRVHHPEFVAGSMANGISLNKLMDSLGQDAFAATQENARQGNGNTNPRKAYMQQPAVRLSPEGLTWLNSQLEAVFIDHGRIPQTELDKLDGP
jgi:HKD family nuclease